MSRINILSLLMIGAALSLLIILICLVTFHRADQELPSIKPAPIKMECFKGRELLKSSPSRR